MGSGKSTVGRELASLLDWEFMDLDRYIEHKKGLKISEIFSTEGETAFRAIEAEAVRDAVIMHKLQNTDLVLSLGGGTLQIAAVRNLILRDTICVWLKCSEDSLLERIGRNSKARPLASNSGREELLERLHERTAVYSLAEITVDADGKAPYVIAEEIRQRLITMEEPQNEQ